MQMLPLVLLLATTTLEAHSHTKKPELNINPLVVLSAASEQDILFLSVFFFFFATGGHDQRSAPCYITDCANKLISVLLSGMKVTCRM